MAIEVMLLDDVQGLGGQGEVVRVSEGYARNFLFPRKLGAVVTAANKRRLEKLQKDRAVREMALGQKAQELSARIATLSCTVAAKTSADGKLFGSVGVAEILECLRKQGVELEKAQVLLAAPFKELGVFEVPLKLHSKVETTLKVWIVEE